MKKPPKAGQYVYTCSEGWLSTDIEVHRQVVLESRPGRLVIGESRHPDSWTTSCGNGTSDYACLYETPDEAIEAYIDFRIELARHEIGEKEKEIAELKREIVHLQKYDRKKIPTKSFPDDWVPCVY